MKAVWFGCLSLLVGFMAGLIVQQVYLAPPPIIYRTAPVRVEPANLRQSCTEVARMCYARKRSEAVGDAR